MTEDSEKLCFVIGPLGDSGTPVRTHADWLLKYIVEPVFATNFPQCVERYDKIAAPGMIDSQIINRLLNAPLVVADMSFENANTFYEMGIRHLKRLPMIHMFHEGHPIPFDVKPHRAIPFKLAHPDDLELAKVELKNAVDEVLKPGFELENPITRARGVEKFDEHAMPEFQVLRSELVELKSKTAEAASLATLAIDMASRVSGSAPAPKGSIADVFRFSTGPDTSLSLPIDDPRPKRRRPPEA
jgi:hypothetical protein